MSDYILDWKASHLDGDNSISGSDGPVGVHISTPENDDWDSWALGEVGGQSDQLVASCVNDPTTVTATFDAPIENVSFELLDVDSDNCNWDDRVTIIARDAQGNIVPVQFSDLESHHHVNGGVLNTNGDSGQNNVTVTIAGPIVSLEIILDNGAGADYSGKVGVGDLHFDLAAGDLDGYVDGTDGSDVIGTSYVGDPDGDQIDSNDEILPGENAQDDVVLAGAGDDLVLAGDGDDEVYGGTGDDTLCGQDGNDVMYGGQGADILEGMNGNDLLFGQAGDDRIYGDAGDDVMVGDAGDDKIYGGLGQDVAHGGVGEDTIKAGSGDDVVYGGGGSDSIDGGTGDDTLIGGGRSFNGTLDFNDLAQGDLVNGQYLGQGVHISSADPHNPVMIFDSANPTGGDNDLATNNLGNVLILSEDRDGNDPDDNVSGGTFVFEFDGPAFVDTIRLLDMEQAGEIRLYDVDGNLFKTITTGTSADNGQFDQIICEHGVLRMEIDLNGSGALDNLTYVLDGEAVDAGDIINGGAGDDYIAGQAGDDILTGGDGADEIYGGDDADTIIGGNDGDVVDGGTGGNDNDTLDLSGQGPLRVINETNDADGNSTSGTVEFLDADGNVTGTLDFTEIENLILPENTGPDAVDDGATTDEDTSVTIPVLANDTDPEGDQLTVTDASSPYGDVVINPDGTITFTPNLDFNGDAEITYTITDGNGNEDTATVTVTVTSVNDLPDAFDDTASTDEDTPVTIDVLLNDDDVDGDVLTVVSATSPDGDVVINPDGTITFTPNPDFTGEAEIIYTVDDGNGGTDTATVTVTVGAVNDDPDAVDSAYVVSQNEAAGDTDGNAITDDTGAGQDSDPEGDTLTVTQVAGAAASVGAVVAGSNGGLFTIDANGAIDFDANGEFDALADGETAQTTVTYTISDGNGGTDTANVTFTVEGTNDGPVATDNGYNVAKTEGAGDVDGNVITDDTGAGVDSDPEDDTLSVIAVNGEAGNVSTAVVGDNGGTFTINPDGTVDFDAGDDFADLGLGDSVTTSVTYTISDGNGGTDTGVASFTISGSNDGTVEGTAGADLIDDTYVGDPDGDLVDNGDAILPGHEGNDDLIYAYGGDDSVVAGAGSDTVYGGTGNDTIDTSNPNGDALPDVGYPGLYASDTDPNNDLDTVFGGAGDDTILTGDDDDSISGGAGNDTIDAGWDDDLVEGNAGNDTILGNEGNDEIYGGAGDDLIYGGLDNSAPDVINIPDDGSGPFGPDLVPQNNGDTIFGGAGDDTIFGKDDDDTLFGGTGDDVLDGGVDDDLLDGGTGDDVLIGGQGDDTLLGGDGDDTLTGGIGDDVLAGGFGSDLFIGGDGGDNVVGGEDPDGNDVDVLDLTGSNVDFITYNEGDPESGVVTFLDGSTMTFAEIENVIPCFTPGTTIATPKGERLVEDLKVGDRVITRDNGIQEIAWVGHKQMNGKTLATNPHLKPIMIKAGALGQGLPERDMLVSPNHRLLVASELTQLYFEEREVLAAAKHMTGAEGIFALDVMATTYVHFMFEAHEVVLSDGAWTESFQPGDYSLKGIGNSQRNEIFELFPELATKTGLEGYQSARRALKKHEARLLLK